MIQKDTLTILYQTAPFPRIRRSQRRRQISSLRGLITSGGPRYSHGTTMATKAATISRPEIVTSLPANVHMFAESAKDQNRCSNVNHVLNLEAWEEALSDHPDNLFRNYIIDGIINGVNIGYSGQSSNIICKNWPSANKYHDAVEDIIRQDVIRGRKVGPFHTPPEQFVGSPLGAFEKKHTPGKYCVIHDLSWPPGHSVNEQITEDCSVHYVTI